MTEKERLNGICDLSEIWRLAGEVFPYFEECKVDWDRAYEDYLSRVLSADSVEYVHLLLAEFLNLLGDGHTDYRFPAPMVKERGFLPFHLLYLDGEWRIGEIIPGREELLLARVLDVNGVKLAEFLKQCFRYIYHVGDYAAPERLEWIFPFLLKKSGNELRTSKGMLSFDLKERWPDMVGVQTPQVEGFCRVKGTKQEMRAYGGILYVRMDDFMYAGAAGELAVVLDKNMEGTDQKAAGVILDLRKNIGGMTAYAAKVAELFIGGSFSACQKKTRQIRGIDLSSASQYIRMKEEAIAETIREGISTRDEVERCLRTAGRRNFETYQDTFGAPGHRALFDGPVILLVSRGTISAAEDFTAMFKSTRRAVLMGTPTLGTTGTPHIMHLRLGGFGRVCSVGYRLLDGTEFIGKGIMPDILAKEGEADCACGRDVLLEQALWHLREMPSASQGSFGKR